MMPRQQKLVLLVFSFFFIEVMGTLVAVSHLGLKSIKGKSFSFQGTSTEVIKKIYCKKTENNSSFNLLTFQPNTILKLFFLYAKLRIKSFVD